MVNGGMVSMIVFNDFVSDSRVLKEAESLSRAGFQVEVVALHFSGRTLEGRIPYRNFHVNRLKRLPKFLEVFFDGLVSKCNRAYLGSGNSLWYFLKFLIKLPLFMVLFVRLLFYFWKVRPDIIHSNDVNTLLPGFCAKKFFGTKLVYDAHEICVAQEGYRHIKGVLYFLEKWLVHSADAMFTTTELRAKKFCELYGVAMPYVLNNKPRFKESKNSQRIRTFLNLDERPIALYQGGFQSGRGLHNIIRLSTRMKHVHFVLIGSGPQKFELKRFASKLPAGDNLHFIPHISLRMLHEYTCSADLGLQLIRNTCLNHYTTDSNKLFEYLMAGLPVVASNFPEITKVVKELKCGLTVDPDDLDAIESAINKILSDAPEQKVRFVDTKKASWEEGAESILVDRYIELAS